VCQTKVETILWDNPHFYSHHEKGQWCCRCETCQKLFRKKIHHAMPNSLTNSVQKFRDSSLFEILSELTGLVHIKKKRNAVCLVSPEENGTQKLWEDIAELPSVDEMVVKPFWKRTDKSADIVRTYHECSKKLLQLTSQFGKEGQIWVKNFSIEKNSEECVAEATYAAYNEGIRNIFSWSYKGSQSMSKYRCDNPDRVWKIQTDAFSECRDKAIINEMIVTMQAIKSEKGL